MPKQPLLLKGLEDEIYTGKADGRVIGIKERIDQSLPGFKTEPDMRNPEITLPPLRNYDELGAALVRARASMRNWLQREGNYTLVPGATMSLGDSNVFHISDPDNDYYKFIRDTYGTRVVTTSMHVSIGIDNVERIMQATRLLRAEASLYLALTAASPFLDGEATGHHSTRWMIFPHTTPEPSLFTTHEEYKCYMDKAVNEGRFQNNRHLWVSARPNGTQPPDQLNRVELRICDQIYAPRIALGIAALTEARIQQMLTDPSLDPLVSSALPSSTRAADLQELISENERAVAKHSLDATVRHWRDGRKLPAREWLGRYLTEAHTLAEEHGFGQVLLPLFEILNHGNTAMQWLEKHRKGATIQTIMEQATLDMEVEESTYARHMQYGKKTHEVNQH